MSFKITEEYVQAAIALEQAGYEWQPGPGDWILDKEDQSIGILTTPVEKAWLMRRLNTHLPTNVQVDELLASVGVTWSEQADSWAFVAADKTELVKYVADEYCKDRGLYRLRALTEYYKKQNPAT